MISSTRQARIIFSHADSRRIQQERPPFFPLFIPSCSMDTGTEQCPYFSICFPPGSLPHFLNSQQFILSSFIALILRDMLTCQRDSFDGKIIGFKQCCNILGVIVIMNPGMLTSTKACFMLYVYILFCLALLIGVTKFFLSSLKNGRIPANAQLLVYSWNSIIKKE